MERSTDDSLDGSVAMPFIDPGSGVPLHMQLERQIKQLIVLGTWGAGSSIPSVRRLAARLGVNPNTTARVYRRLESEGVLTAVPGGGTFVSEKRQKDGIGAGLRDLHPMVHHLVKEGIRLQLKKEDVLVSLESEWELQERCRGKESDKYE